MKKFNTLIYQLNDGIATITLNRPDKFNAFDAQMIEELTAVFTEIEKENFVRVVVITAEGPHFCAGADLKWMQKMAHSSIEENKRDAEALSQLLSIINHLSKPTIALIKGRVFGGGIGIVACVDVVIAAKTTQFCFSEVKLGLIPATIAPFVIQAIGQRAARRYFLTAEMFDSHRAATLGLVHQVVELDEQAWVGFQLARSLLNNAPEALKKTKELLNDYSGIDVINRQKTALLLAEVRSSKECQEGIDAFFNKRKPDWALQNDS